MPTVKLKGSVDALVSVLVNLAENAMQACEKNCEIEINVYQQSQHIIFSVNTCVFEFLTISAKEWVESIQYFLGIRFRWIIIIQRITVDRVLISIWIRLFR
jgi:hypothetical protein